MPYNWIPMFGAFERTDNDIVFRGGTDTGPDGRQNKRVGAFVSDQVFGGGLITGEVTFIDSAKGSACGFMVFYDPLQKAFTWAGLGTGGFCGVATWTGSQWTTHSAVGDPNQVLPDHAYKVGVEARGSRVTIVVDGVTTLAANLPFALPQAQAGIWCTGPTDVRIRNFTVAREFARAFVVMQFTDPYDELFNDVIAPVCKEVELVPIRSDQRYGPGLIVADIAREIVEAKVIIADITPRNPNVYYEVGYAHALKKPTILIADKVTELPFDVSPYRVLLYENTIGGKARAESGLRKHLEAILKEYAIA